MRIDVHVSLFIAISGAAPGALNDGVGRSELGMQGLTSDVEADLDGLGGHGDPTTGIPVFLTEYRAQCALDPPPVVG